MWVRDGAGAKAVRLRNWMRQIGAGLKDGGSHKTSEFQSLFA